MGSSVPSLALAHVVLYVPEMTVLCTSQSHFPLTAEIPDVTFSDYSPHPVTDIPLF